MTAELLELKTYKQPGDVVIQLKRFENGYERTINGSPQEWGTSGDNAIPHIRMVQWKSFEESIGSELL